MRSVDNNNEHQTLGGFYTKHRKYAGFGLGTAWEQSRPTGLKPSTLVAFGLAQFGFVWMLYCFCCTFFFKKKKAIISTTQIDYKTVEVKSPQRLVLQLIDVRRLWLISTILFLKKSKFLWIAIERSIIILLVYMLRVFIYLYGVLKWIVWLSNNEAC